MLSEKLNIYNRQGGIDSLALKQLFFNPSLYASYGPDRILAGFAEKQASPIDPRIVESVRSFLFGPPGSKGSDLAALNIQRGRDHKLPRYNEMRDLLGYEPVYYFLKSHQFDQNGITTDAALANNLERVYGDVDQVDLWVGGLSEDGFFGGLLGPTFTSIIVEQFLRLREGDRFWYERIFPSGPWRNYINSSSLASVLKRNSPETSNLFDNSPFISD